MIKCYDRDTLLNMSAASVPRVCVIGAGAAGLAVLRHLTRQPGAFDVVAFEQTDRIGGLWVYSPNTGVDEYNQPIGSSLYKHLRTNAPKEVMGFADFPFPEDTEHSYLTHEDMLAYLDNYCQHFDLRKHITFLTKVEHVTPATPGDANSKWHVTVSRVDQPQVKTHNMYDAVIIGNGHYSIPKTPELEGLATWRGEWLHSHSYRVPEKFTGKRVLCLGAGVSGVEIASILAPYAKKVYLSHSKSPVQGLLAENIEQVPAIRRLTETSVILNDEREVTIDTLMFCTGYLYKFPFLDPACKITVDEHEHVADLYKHCLNIHHPNMLFIGITQGILPFPVFHAQMQFFLAVLEGRFQVPSKDEMLRDTNIDMQLRRHKGMSELHMHHLFEAMWPYIDEIAGLGGVKPLPSVYQRIWKHVFVTRKNQAVKFREYDYKVIDNDNFEIIEPVDMS